jgi:hypothetical protein
MWFSKLYTGTTSQVSPADEGIIYSTQSTVPIRRDIEIVHRYNVTGLNIQYSKYGIPMAFEYTA